MSLPHSPPSPSFRRAIILVADGVGCGGAPDAAAYGDAGADTLGNLSRAVGGLALPNLGALGLGNLTAIAGVPGVSAPAGAWGAMCEASSGKDTITGHWEMAGLVTAEAMATFPHGFPRAITDELRAAAGRDLIGNKTASGTAIIDELGPAHLATGALILYTSADSVLQIAAHEEIVPLPELYAICEKARAIADRHRIGRVIARPFVGRPGAFKRTYNRRDYALVPPEPTLCDVISAAGLPVVGVGKIGDIFAGRGVGESIHSEGNVDGLRLTLEAMARVPRGLLFVNLVDFDMVYGHRNDVPGFARALAELDAWLPAFRAALAPGDAAFITADHGNDPTTPGTDHTRERAPLLAFGPAVRPAPLGDRASFCDLGQTIAAGLGVPALARGRSFLDVIAR
ncbi:MAG TPA: phosphopentomutase [Polyangia bacterium]|jgi:phosphopentomutase|nr:phosphopentomutase [Polyangia bacterium]